MGGVTPWDRPDYSRPAKEGPSQLYPQELSGQTYRGEWDNGKPIYTETREGVSRLNGYEGTVGGQVVADAEMVQSAAEETIGLAGDADLQSLPQQGQNGYSPYAGMKPEDLPAVHVAILLPLSGQHASIGQALLRSAQLALFDIGFKNFKLIPRDTRGTAMGAREAAQQAVAERAQLVLGPLFAHSVDAARQVLRPYNINMIAFSTDWSLAGGNSFIMGFLPFAQVQRVVQYAQGQGYEDIGILSPDTDYGNAVIASYNSLAYHFGFNQAEIVRFPANEKDISEIVKSFTYYDERKKELEDMIRSLEIQAEIDPDDIAVQTELNSLKKMDSWGSKPYDAVLLPMGGDQLRSVSNLISFYDLGPKETKRLGTGLWDDRGLAREPGLQGGWFAAPSPDLRLSFEQKYETLYGAKPPRLSTLSYDATALAAILAIKGLRETGRPAYDIQSIMNPNGFAGLDGIFRFRTDRLVERGLAIMEIKDGQVNVIDPAPNTFESYSSL